MLIIKSAVLTKLIQHPPSGAVNLEEESCVFIKHFSCEIPLRCCLDANNTVCLQQGRSARTQPCTFCPSLLQQQPHEWAPLSPLPPRKGNWGRDRGSVTWPKSIYTHSESQDSKTRLSFSGGHVPTLHGNARSGQLSTKVQSVYREPWQTLFLWDSPPPKKVIWITQLSRKKKGRAGKMAMVLSMYCSCKGLQFLAPASAD